MMDVQDLCAKRFIRIYVICGLLVQGASCTADTFRTSRPKLQMSQHERSWQDVFLSPALASTKRPMVHKMDKAHENSVMRKPEYRPPLKPVKTTPKDKPTLHTKPSLNNIHTPHFGMVPNHENIPRRPPLKASYSVEGTFLWTVGLFGTFENGAIVLTGIFCKGFQRPLHMLVTSLAATDLFISVIYIPSYTYFLLEGSRPLEQEESASDVSKTPMLHRDMTDSSFCTIGHAIFIEIASVTLTLKALIAIYLYIVSVSKTKCKQYFSRRNTITFIFLAWIINFVVLYLPSFVGYSKVDFYPSTFQCMFDTGETEELVELYGMHRMRNQRMFYTFIALVLHFAELLVVCVCFVKVHNSIAKGRAHWDTNQNKKHIDVFSNYSRALKTMLMVFTSFFVCWLPIYVINIIDPFHIKLPMNVHHLAMDLLLLKSAINPSIYIYAIRSLRYEMKALCLCRCPGIVIQTPQKTPDTSFVGPIKSGSTGCDAV